MRPVLDDTGEPLVLIDSTNMFFHIYFKALGTFNRTRHRPRGATISLQNPRDLTGLTSTFESVFRRCLHKILIVADSSPRNVIFATDCPRNEVWRHAALTDPKDPEKLVYKATRAAKRDPGIKAVIIFMYDDLIPRVLPGHKIGAAHAEADDVIGVLTRLVNHRAPDRRVVIISDDSDFIQLLTHPYTEIYNQRLARMRPKCKDGPITALRVKCLMGDRSDNIGPAFPRCGPKTARRLAADPAALAAKVAQYGDERLKRNTRLIDLNYTPDTIKSRIIEAALLLITTTTTKTTTPA